MTKELYIVINGDEREEFDNEWSFNEFVGDLIVSNQTITFRTIEETDKKIVVEC